MMDDLEKVIEQEVGSLAHSLAQEMAPSQSQLVSPQQQAKIIAEKLRAEIKAGRKRSSDGMASCIAALRELASNDPEIQVDKIVEELLLDFAKLDSIDTVQRLGKQVLEGVSWKELLGIPDTTLSLLYRGAKWLLEQKRYDEAECAFYLLSTLDAAQPVFWLGFGHANFHLNNFEQALIAYQTLSQCDPNSSWAHVYAASCYEGLQDWPNVRQELESAQKLQHLSGNSDPDLESVITERQILAKNHGKSQ